MPRVTEQYIQRRRRQILDAAWRCFAHNGFHATTMDDVIEAAGASPSVVYRWFRGKDELVTAVVLEALAGLLEAERELLRREPPPTLADAVEYILTSAVAWTTRSGEDLSALAVQTWTEALRSPEVHELVAGQLHQLRDGLAELIRRQQALGAIPAGVDADAAARPLFALFPGFVLQRVLFGPEDPLVYARAASALLLGGTAPGAAPSDAPAGAVGSAPPA
jgi:AcrR family transcriptional regulator